MPSARSGSKRPNKRTTRPVHMKATSSKKPPPMRELAAADTRRIALGLGFKTIPYNPDDLVGKKGGLAVYDNVAKDEQVKACLTLKKCAVIGPGWKIKPASSDDADKRLAEDITNDLKGVRGTLEDALWEILSGMKYGFSLTEKMFVLDNGRIKIAALKTRAPHSLDFEQDPFGNVVSIEQDGDKVISGVGPEKFIHYVHNPEFSNPYGRSDLREAYDPWWHKQNWRQWSAIFGEQLAVPPAKGSHPRNALPADVTTFKDDVLDKLQARTGITLPEGWDIQLLEANRNPQDYFVAMIDRHDLAICKALLLPDKLGLVGGEVSAGSFSLAQEQMGAFFFVLEMIARRLETVIQEQLIVQIAQFKAPSRKVPEFKLLPLGEENKKTVADLWIKAVTVGAVRGGLDDENYLRELLGFPPHDESDDSGTLAPGVKPGGGMIPGAPPSGPPQNGNKITIPAQMADDAQIPTELWRPLTNLERRADMQEKRQTIEDSTAAAQVALASAAADTVKDIFRRVKAQGLGLPDTDPMTIERLQPSRRIRVGLQRQMRGVLSAAYERGARDARGEVRRGRGQSVSLEEAMADERMLMEDRVGIVGVQAKRYFQARTFWIAGVLEDAIISDAKAYLFNAIAADVTPSQLTYQLDQVLNKWLPEYDTAGRVVNVPHRIETIARTNMADAIEAGRWATFTDPELDGVVTALTYSAILDARTRASHAAWDGVTLPPQRWVGPPNRRPPNGYMCRCTLIPVLVDDNVQITTNPPGVEVIDAGFKARL